MEENDTRAPFFLNPLACCILIKFLFTAYDGSFLKRMQTTPFYDAANDQSVSQSTKNPTRL